MADTATDDRQLTGVRLGIVATVLTLLILSTVAYWHTAAVVSSAWIGISHKAVPVVYAAEILPSGSDLGLALGGSFVAAYLCYIGTLSPRSRRWVFNILRVAMLLALLPLVAIGLLTGIYWELLIWSLIGLALIFLFSRAAKGEGPPSEFPGMIMLGGCFYLGLFVTVLYASVWRSPPQTVFIENLNRDAVVFRSDRAGLLMLDENDALMWLPRDQITAIRKPKATPKKP